MKECKILNIEAAHWEHFIQGRNNQKRQPGIVDYPEMEKFLGKYLNEGFTVKCMTHERDPLGVRIYTFYLERDV